MSHKTQFSKELNKLFKLRTYWLSKELFERKPKSPVSYKLKKKDVDHAIFKMQNIASEALTKTLVKDEFDKCVKQEKAWKISGRSFKNKEENFKVWFNDHFGDTKSYIYAFWTKGKKTCLYAGRSGNGVNRCAGHFNDIEVRNAEWVEIYKVNKQDLVKMECLTIHHFNPKYNENKAASQKFKASCRVRFKSWGVNIKQKVFQV